MSRFVFGLVMGVILTVLMNNFGEYIFGYFGLDPDSYVNLILSMKGWLAEFLPS